MSLYQASGGRLGAETGFGVDSLSVSTELIQEWQAAMKSNIPSPEELFGHTVNGLFQPFSDSLKFMINVSTDLSVSVDIMLELLLRLYIMKLYRLG